MHKIKSITFNNFDESANIKSGTTNDGWHDRQALIIQERDANPTISSLDIITEDGTDMRHFARLTLLNLGDTMGIEIELPDHNEITLTCRNNDTYLSLCHYREKLSITIESPNTILKERSQL